MIRKIKNIYHFGEALLASMLFGFPGKKMTVIGVTGTDGKTTTTHCIYHILKSAGKKVSMTSSIYADIAGEVNDTGLHITTQSRWKIQNNIRKAVRHGDDYFVLETTSHGIDQYRVWGIHFKVGVLTNVSREHLDYHKTYGNYAKTKAKLLLSADTAIYNKDDQSYNLIDGIMKKHHKRVLTYSLKEDVQEGTDVSWSADIKTSIKEDYNKQNILAAYACCLSLGIDKESMLKGIESFVLPKGRMDIVYDKDFMVIVDFAHTPHSIRQLLKNIKRRYKRKIIHIFGSAGERDQEKRIDMGRASSEFADAVILTEEDYRNESFTNICKSIEKGLLENSFTFCHPDKMKEDDVCYTVIQDRSEAILYGIRNAKKGEVVVITGKSHEKSLARGRKEFSWDEYQAVKDALADKCK